MTPVPEFSHGQRLDTLGSKPLSVTIAANADERRALADRFGLVALDALSAELSLVRDGEAVTMSGRVAATAVQACIATGDGVRATIDEPLRIRFLPDSALADAGPGEIELAEPDCDVVGYAGGVIDLGEAVAETMALALDPFPRSPDAEAALRAAGVIREDEAQPLGAFAGLRDKLAGKA